MFLLIKKFTREGERNMKIVKRDGHIVDYDPAKIRTAIGKANNEVRGKEKVTEEQIQEIIQYIEDLNKKRILVEDIQDMIEETGLNGKELSFT